MIVIVVVAVIAIRAVTGGDTAPQAAGRSGSRRRTSARRRITASPSARQPSGRRPGARRPGVLPALGSPWGAAARSTTGCRSAATCRARSFRSSPTTRPGHQSGSPRSWSAELQAGDGFFTPEQGSQIVVKCILGTFYGDNPVNSDVKVNEKTTIDGHDAWLVESQLTFDIAGLKTKGELLIVAIVSAGNRSGSTTPRSPTPSPTRPAGPGGPEAAPGRRLAISVHREVLGMSDRAAFLQSVRLVTTGALSIWAVTPSHIDSARECEPWVVSRSGRRTRSLPVLGRQGLVGSNLAQSERATAITGSRWRRHNAAGRQTGTAATVRADSRVRPGMDSPRTASRRTAKSYGSAYANYQELQKKKSPIGWWIAGAALVIVIVVVAVLAIRAVTGGDTGTTGGPVGQPSQDVCPPQILQALRPPSRTRPTDESTEVRSPTPCSVRHGGRRKVTNPVPFGSDVQSQIVVDQANYDGQGRIWVASILVAELQAGDGFFTPEQGSQIVVKCILGAFYGDNPVNSNVKVNEKTTIDGHEAWLVESQLTFDIAGLKTKGELLIVAIVSAGNRSGLYYASIPDTTPELVQPARDALKHLQVDG